VGPTISEIAEAFSRHEFDRTFPHMDADIEWAQIGEGHVRGKADVATACERSTEYLAGVRTTFSGFKIVAAENCVVIDSRAEYVDAEGESSQVASCDIYDFIDGSLVAITTYAVEIDSSAAD
jgi:limonene-1,2-epoxide hydrolase